VYVSPLCSSPATLPCISLTEATGLRGAADEKGAVDEDDEDDEGKDE
jgi:hypothetical protein